MSGTDYTITPNVGLYKPISNRAIGTWGDLWNSNADALDAALGSVANVRSFRAKGDGTTDDTTAIQAAANAIPAAGGTLYFPKGTYLVRATTLIKSNTRVAGDGPGSVMLADNAWAGAPYNFLLNVNNTATTLTDHDFVVEDLQFDYGTFLPANAPGGGMHQVSCFFARNVTISRCTFQVRGGENATALVGCYNTLTEGCSAYDFINCAYDHWYGPQHARVIGCYAETATSVQMVNFNPEQTHTSGGGMVADGLVLANNQFVATGANHVPVQVEPLSAGTTVQNVIITGNILTNVSLSMRGDVRSAVVANNTLKASRGGGEVIVTYPNNGATAADFVVSGNTIIDPDTSGASTGVIRMQGVNAIIVGNRISGTGYVAAAVYADNPASVVLGNSTQSTGITAPPLNLPNGLTTTSLGITGGLGLFASTPVAAKPTVTGAWAGNTAGKALTTALAAYGLFTDSTTA
jgi:hypothetical protein